MTSPDKITPLCVCGDPACVIPYGTCHCGCGGNTTISKINRYDRGVFQGKPTLRLRGHAKVNNFISADRYTIEYRGYKTPCWIWKECVNSTGYGRISRQDKSTLAHVAMYEQHRGPIPKGLEPDHLCRIPRCVNPHHLELVPHVINMRRGNSTVLVLEQAIKVRELRKVGMKYRELAAMFNVAQSTIWAILSGRTWRE